MTARVLVVDDVSFNVKLLQTKLEQEYYEVFVAADGKEAIEKTREIQPDIILMDGMMPEMDGFEATTIIKSDPSISHIPVIMVTALNAQEDKVRGLASGADDFLTKPINDQALMARLKSLLRLKFMTDELRLRNETWRQLGVTGFHSLNLKADIVGSKVLAVDDDIAQVQKMHDRFKEVGVIMDSTASVGEAYKLALINSYSLIIISTQLMDGDGLRLCSHIRSQDELRNTPILIMIDENDTALLAKGLEIGATDYLVMPIDPNELMVRGATQIRRKKFQDELKNSYVQSVTMSITDPLTNISNRRYFDIHSVNLLNTAKAQNKVISLLMVDIDFFKKINDTYGHQAGDVVLREAASRLLYSVRASDLCARYGGEEFVVVMPGTNAQEAQVIAERIRSSMESTKFAIEAQGLAIDCTCSIGLSSLQEGDEVSTLLGRADKALYMAKNNGRNQVQCL